MLFYRLERLKTSSAVPAAFAGVVSRLLLTAVLKKRRIESVSRLLLYR